MDIELIINEVIGVLHSFGYNGIEHDVNKLFHVIHFHVDNGSDSMPTRHKDAISMLTKGYLNVFSYKSDRQYIYINKELKGIDPDDDRYSCLIHEMIHVQDNKRTKEEVDGKEIFINRYDHFDRFVCDYPNKFFQAAIDDFESQSASSKQLEELMGEFGRITDEMAALYQRKNMDYGNSFGRTYRELGIISAVTRMSDKMERMKRLARKPEAQQVADESLRDTIRDLACYAVMTLMEMDREQEGGRE